MVGSFVESGILFIWGPTYRRFPVDVIDVIYEPVLILLDGREIDNALSLLPKDTILSHWYLFVCI